MRTLAVPEDRGGSACVCVLGQKRDRTEGKIITANWPEALVSPSPVTIGHTDETCRRVLLTPEEVYAFQQKRRNEEDHTTKKKTTPESQHRKEARQKHRRNTRRRGRNPFSTFSPSTEHVRPHLLG